MKKNNAPLTKEDAFIQEVNEELKNERMKNIWEKYGLYIVLFVVAILTATVSFETIRNWNIRRHQNLSDRYAVALALQNQGKNEQSILALESIEKDAPKSIYADTAQIQIANIWFEQNKVDEGIAVLEKYLSQKNANSQLQKVAAIKLASYKLDKAPAEEIETLLSPLAAENGNWTGIAQEMLAMLAIREKNMAKAQDLYTQIVNNPNTPDRLKSRAQDMLLILSEDTK